MDSQSIVIPNTMRPNLPAIKVGDWIVMRVDMVKYTGSALCTPIAFVREDGVIYRSSFPVNITPFK